MTKSSSFVKKNDNYKYKTYAHLQIIAKHSAKFQNHSNKDVAEVVLWGQRLGQQGP